MGTRRRYRKRATSFVIAVQLNLDTGGFTYEKWGGAQRCASGDWLVCNDGDTYTIDQAVFAKTYRRVSPGVYVKSQPVWAEVARAAGVIQTKEGSSRYEAGDYIVYNDDDGTDGYCMTAAKFESMYEPD